jgi:hypothetical protein
VEPSDRPCSRSIVLCLSRATAPREPSHPWGPFLDAIDQKLTEQVQLQCLGGFVVTQYYGIDRGTSDIDCIVVLGSKAIDFAGEGSDLHRRYGPYLQYVAVVTPPCDYHTRLQRMFPSTTWQHLELWALDATNLALSKLERNFDRDREDFRLLARASGGR